MTTELLVLIAAHFACADIAEQRRMSFDEIQYCSGVYKEIKLAFVPGVDAEDFANLTRDEQISVNKSGFLAFIDWRRRCPAMVSHLEAVARGEAELATAG
ncbi:hypothetical protein [Silicimonas sp. MF1-12-2]|uniref:hypothetical protein n=1 Tax=Silicimonas sp. MF1-12-2 TaxID=3384793 RepID=UPI0039B42173